MNIVKYMLFSSLKTNNWDKKNLVHSICFFSFGSYIFVSYIFLLSLGVWNHESQTRWPTSTLALLPSNYRNEYYFKLNTPFIGITRMTLFFPLCNKNEQNKHAENVTEKVKYEFVKLAVIFVIFGNKCSKTCIADTASK